MGTRFEVRGTGCVYLVVLYSDIDPGPGAFLLYRLTVNSQPRCIPNFSSTRSALKSCFGSRRKREPALNRGRFGSRDNAAVIDAE